MRADKLNSSVIGDIGEYIVVKELESKGFEVIQFGKAMMNKEQGVTHLKPNIPLLPDTQIGCSFGKFGLIDSTGDIELDWEDSNIPHWADLDEAIIKDYCRKCSEIGNCYIKEKSYLHAPCRKPNKILNQEWLMSITPEHEIFSHLTGDDGKEILLKGNKVVSICLNRMLGILIKDIIKKRELPQNFRMINILVHLYIAAEYSLQNELEANKYGIKWRNHPGRYDLISYKKGVQEAIEVKVNKSKLNDWQRYRASLLMKFGIKLKVAQVFIATEELYLASIGESPNYELEINDFPNNLMVEVPSDEDFFDTLEKHSESFNFISTYFGVKAAIYGLVWE